MLYDALGSTEVLFNDLTLVQFVTGICLGDVFVILSGPSLY